MGSREAAIYKKNIQCTVIVGEMCRARTSWIGLLLHLHPKHPSLALGDRMEKLMLKPQSGTYFKEKKTIIQFVVQYIYMVEYCRLI